MNNVDFQHAQELLRTCEALTDLTVDEQALVTRGYQFAVSAFKDGVTDYEWMMDAYDVLTEHAPHK